MDVVEVMGQPRAVMQVARGRGAIVARHRIDKVHRGARGAVMHPRPRQVEVMARVAPVKRDAARGTRQHVLDQRAGKAQAAVVALYRARRHHRRHARGRGL